MVVVRSPLRVLAAILRSHFKVVRQKEKYPLTIFESREDKWYELLSWYFKVP
jgi:hypothetical protein